MVEAGRERGWERRREVEGRRGAGASVREGARMYVIETISAQSCVQFGPVWTATVRITMGSAECRTKKRVLKRRRTNAEFEFSSDWLVFSTGTQSPVPVGPPVLRAGVRCVKVSSTANWLKKLCFNHTTWQQGENHYVAMALAKLRRKVLEEAHLATARNTIDVGGSALQDGHSSDDDSAEVAEEPGVTPANSSIPRIRRRASWVMTEISDTPVKVWPCRGHSVFIEYGGVEIAAVCRLVNETRRQLESEPTADYRALLVKEDEGKVKHNRFKRVFAVTTLGRNGRKTIKDFEIRLRDDEEDTISDEQLAKKVLQLARRYWNQCDAGILERYDDALL